MAKQLALDPKQTSILGRAAPEEVVSALARTTRAGGGLALSPSNPFDLSAYGHLAASGGEVQPGDVPQYAEHIARGALAHSMDSWSYLARALGAMLAGDVPVAVHLTYYAELRATLSLLGCEGIGVHNRLSFVVTGATTVEKICTKGTHEAAWLLLSGWAALPGATQLFSRVVSPTGIEIVNWPADATGALPPYIDVILQGVAADLGRLYGDSDRRNFFSYNPQGAPSRVDLDTESGRSQLLETWRLVQPGAGRPFPILDLELVAPMLHQKVVEAWAGAAEQDVDVQELEAGASDEKWAAALGPLVPASISDVARQNLLATVRRCKTGPVWRATVEQPGGDLLAGDQLLAMMTRTLLLARVATGACAHLMADAGVGRDLIEPWLARVAARRGLIDQDSDFDGGDDLWGDVEPLLEVLATLAGLSAGEGIRALGYDGVTLSQLERVPCWSY